MSNVFIVEKNVDEYETFEKFSDAVKFAVDYINDPLFTVEEQRDRYKELILSIVERDAEKWGMGYALDDFLWCWEIPFHEAGSYKLKEERGE